VTLRLIRLFYLIKPLFFSEAQLIKLLLLPGRKSPLGFARASLAGAVSQAYNNACHFFYFRRPLKTYPLIADDVHVWWAAIQPPPRSLPGLLALLSADEKARAQRFHFERHRLRYIAGRACLRLLLGDYLGLDPAQIEFEYSPLGKPALKMGPDGRVLQFNLSNSEERALYVFSWQRLVGIDLELAHALPEEDDFARQFFCETEYALLHSLSGEEKSRTFFEFWTCKEALLKAMGTGLTTPINQVEVAIQSGVARLVAIAGDPAPAADWQLSLFRPAPAYQAALAISGGDFKTSFFNATDEFSPE